MVTTNRLTREDSGKDVSLAQLLVRGLRSKGYRKISKGEAHDFTVGARNMSVNLLLIVMVGIGIFAINWLSWNFWTTVVVILGSLCVIVTLIYLGILTHQFAYLFYVVVWLGAALVQVVKGDLGDVGISHLLPFGIIIGFRWAIRAIRLTTHVPFFIPLALVIVLLPLLTEDPWRLAAAAGPQIAILAGISILPLALLFVARLVRAPSHPIFLRGAESISKGSEREVPVLEQLNKLRSNDENELDEAATAASLRRAYGHVQLMEKLDTATTLGSRAFKWRALLRFISLVAGIGLAVWVLIYAIAYAAVPPSLAAEWSKHPIPFRTLDLVLFSQTLPVGPYILVASLLTTVASVGFLGFALTEDQYSDALWDALVYKPVEEYLLLAVPYLVIAESHGYKKTKRLRK